MTIYTKAIPSIFVVFLAIFFAQNAYAAHIVGGEITYECLGDNNYRFTLNIYRDCASGGAPFDSFGGNAIRGTVSIYDGNALLTNINLNTPEIRNIPSTNDDPCLEIPPDICVERGVYQFDRQLPPSSNTYTITYSRCCRNSSISNIFVPGDTGATYTIDITPTAQNSCNNSPVYSNFPEIVICSGEPLNFDHSATDADGDQLVYSFCSPFTGGGNGGQGGFGGVAPNPDAPPPYINVNFRAPNFTANAPIGGDPIVTIDPVTGLITGTPTIRGQFVVGVCVEEFRNGELLSTVRRDFQFNVELCDPFVSADILEDEFLGDSNFAINLCGDRDFQFVNQSAGEVSDFRWEFDFGPQGIQTFSEWEPFVTFPDTGQFVGALILNAMAVCGDTANIVVNVFPEIEADFETNYDTCLVGPVVFTDRTITNGSNLVDWDWDFGDGGEAVDPNPLHQYDEFGIKNVSLVVEDDNGCMETVELEFDWTPVPVNLNVQPSSFILCSSDSEVTFNNLTSPIDTTFDVTWNFGDGSISKDLSPTYRYEDLGTFTVSLEIVSPFDCAVNETFNNWITIQESPTAAFSFTPDESNNLRPQVFFNDESSSDVSNWQWDFGGLGASRDQNPSFIFRDSGLQDIVLLVTAENGCVDTAFAVVDIVPVDTYFLPNAFTPNNDDSNDTYQGVGALENIQEFNMKIWDRYGELVFETDDQFQGWNGQRNNSGSALPSGVYVVLVTYESARDGERQLKGYATLVR